MAWRQPRTMSGWKTTPASDRVALSHVIVEERALVGHARRVGSRWRTLPGDPDFGSRARALPLSYSRLLSACPVTRCGGRDLGAVVPPVHRPLQYNARKPWFEHTYQSLAWRSSHRVVLSRCCQRMAGIRILHGDLPGWYPEHRSTIV